MINRVEKGWALVGWLSWLFNGPTKDAGAMLQSDLLAHELGIIKEMGAEVATALAKDPPRQDFDQIALTRTLTAPTVLPGSDKSDTHAQKLNNYYTAYLAVLSAGEAAALSLDRYGGASNARNLIWASQQAQALQFYNKEMGLALQPYADSIDGLLQVLVADGFTPVTVTHDALVAAQNSLLTDGFPAGTAEDAQTFGIDAEGLKAMLERLTSDPLEYDDFTVQDLLADLAADARVLAPLMINAPNFPSPASTARSGQAADTSRLARVFAKTVEFQIGNPLSQTATIDLQVRPVSLPGDWLATVTPMTATLQSGETITGFVEVHPGSAAPQGLIPRLAVEGRINGELIGGLVVDIMIPLSAEALAENRIFLPLMMRSPKE